MFFDILNKIVNATNVALKVDSNSTSTFFLFQPKLPKNYDKMRNDK